MPFRLVKVCVVTLLAALVLAGGDAASAQDAGRHALALDLARVLIDDQMRQGLSDQVGIGLLQLIGTRLQERLNRRLQEAELKALVAFQRSAVGRKAALLTPAIARETARAIEGEIAQSPALPRLMEALGREFPVLRAPETP